MAHSLSGLMKWCQREEWRDAFNETTALHLGAPCAKAGVAIENLPDLIGDDRTGVLWGCVFEDFLTRELEDGSNVVDDYLKRRGWNESVPNKRYMMALRSSVISLYEVSDIVRDESFLARDLVRDGEPVRVNEKSGTYSLKQWDRIAARIVQIGSRIEMSGGALPFDYDLSETVLDAIRHAGKKARVALDTETLRTTAFMFIGLWLDDVLDRTLHPKLPDLCNSDGDEIVWTTASYPLKRGTDAKAVRLALAAIPSLRPESETFWNWIGVERRIGKKRPAEKQTIITTLDDGSVVLGTLEMNDRALILEANSRERAERGRTLIEPVLAGLVGQPTIESKTVAEMMASRPVGKSEELSSGLSPDEERAIIHANMDRHYVNLLDEPVPMLGNITPRRAAKTAKGRQKLVDWLKALENGAAREGSGSAMAGYDLRWMWDELGIGKLRR
ncbi:MAG: hypothetical protein KGJ49_01545 [Alphaproteobacteria bacterium]|nr:hypothetical protein [Alphaproteobacteria bacterium]